MDDSALASEFTRQRLARQALMTIAAIILLFWPIDALSTDHVPWETLVVRTVWSAVVLLLARRLPTDRPEAYLSVIRWIVLVSAPALATVTWLAGSVHSALFASLPVLPVAALVFTQDDQVAVQLATALNGVAMIASLLHEPLSWRERVQWLSFAAGMAVVALYGAGLYRRRREAERESERARIEALEKLAASERSRAESGRLALVGQLAAGVAHEINNPLAYVKANLSFLDEQLTALPQELREALGDAREGVTRIAEIVRDLRSFSRTEAEPFASFDLRELFDEAARIASVRMNHTRLVIAPGVELGTLTTSRNRLLQVLVNLLVNAADAIEAARSPDPCVTMHARQVGDRLRIMVEDNGPGIPPELLERIFEPFFTTKAPGSGTGLGLSLSREYVERLSGRLWAENRPGGGAMFVIELPAPIPSGPTRPAAH
jgi:signal transduction histidine kinase